MERGAFNNSHQKNKGKQQHQPHHQGLLSDNDFPISAILESYYATPEILMDVFQQQQQPGGGNKKKPPAAFNKAALEEESDFVKRISGLVQIYMQGKSVVPSGKNGSSKQAKAGSLFPYGLKSASFKRIHNNNEATMEEAALNNGLRFTGDQGGLQYPPMSSLKPLDLSLIPKITGTFHHVISEVLPQWNERGAVYTNEELKRIFEKITRYHLPYLLILRSEQQPVSQSHTGWILYLEAITIHTYFCYLELSEKERCDYHNAIVRKLFWGIAYLYSHIESAWDGEQQEEALAQRMAKCYQGIGYKSERSQIFGDYVDLEQLRTEYDQNNACFEKYLGMIAEDNKKCMMADEDNLKGMNDLGDDYFVSTFMEKRKSIEPYLGEVFLHQKDMQKARECMDACRILLEDVFHLDDMVVVMMHNTEDEKKKAAAGSSGKRSSKSNKSKKARQQFHEYADKMKAAGVKFLEETAGDKFLGEAADVKFVEEAAGVKFLEEKEEAAGVKFLEEKEAAGVKFLEEKEAAGVKFLEEKEEEPGIKFPWDLEEEEDLFKKQKKQEDLDDLAGQQLQDEMDVMAIEIACQEAEDKKKMNKLMTATTTTTTMSFIMTAISEEQKKEDLLRQLAEYGKSDPKFLESALEVLIKQQQQQPSGNEILSDLVMYADKEPRECNDERGRYDPCCAACLEPIVVANPEDPLPWSAKCCSKMMSLVCNGCFETMKRRSEAGVMGCICGRKDEEHFFKANEWSLPREWYWKRQVVDHFEKTKGSHLFSKLFFSL